jgi:hypothetical protein
VDIVGDEKKSDTEKEQKSGLPQISAMHVIIAVAVIVLAVIFIAKFGFGTDLISPSSGEMAIAKQRLVTPVPTLVQDPAVKQSLTIRPERVPTCAAPTTLCGNTCTNRMTDPDNCGICGKVCPAYNFTDRKCLYAICSNACLPNYFDCNQNTADGCEVNTENDAKNCGGCGRVCGTGINCTAYRCRNAIDISGSGPYETYNPPNQMKIE